MKAKLKKPHLTEIFAVYNGIGYAAMGALNVSGGSLSHPLCALEERSSNLRYKLRQDILDNITKPDQDSRQEEVAVQALDFLRSARPTLKEHRAVQLVGATQDAKGGLVGNVIADIDHLLAREAKGAERPLVNSKGGGELFPRVKRDYFPVVSKTRSEEGESKESSTRSVSDDQKIRQATEGRGSKKKVAILQDVFGVAQIDKTIVKVPAQAATVPAETLSF